MLYFKKILTLIIKELGKNILCPSANASATVLEIIDNNFCIGK